MRAHAFFSSSALLSMKATTSAWVTSRITIFAARRVLPPDLMTPANASYPRMKLTGPDAMPPPVILALLLRIVDRLTPAPEPYLNSMASVLARSMIEPMLSWTELMKHAEHCGFASIPTLNQTGELNAIFWWTSRWVSSAWNDARSSSLAK